VVESYSNLPKVPVAAVPAEDTYFRDTLQIISAAFDNFESETFEQLVSDCANALRKGGKIVASGLGKNVPVCEKFVGTMTSLGMPATFMNTNSAMHGDLGYVRKEDVVLILSKSGSTPESIVLYDYIRAWHCEKWLLSFNDGGKLGRIMEKKLLLPLAHEGDPWNIIPNNSSTCYLILLQGIALHLAERIRVPIQEFRNNHPGGAIGLSFQDRY